MKEFYLYRHIRSDKNEVFYIGIGKYRKKWKYQRALTTKNRNIHWKRIINLCDNKFKVEILLKDLTKEEAISKEKEFIQLYGRSDLKLGTLCNLTDGGEGGFNLSEESREKIRIAISGENNYMFGKSHSQDWVNNMKQKMSGKNNPHYGVPLPEWRKEINRRAQLGRKHSEEHIERKALKLRKKVIDIVTKEIYPSITDVALKYGKSPCHMTRLIKVGKYNLKFI